MKRLGKLLIPLAVVVFMAPLTVHAYSYTSVNFNNAGTVQVDFDDTDVYETGKDDAYHGAVGPFSVRIADEDDNLVLNGDGGEWFRAFCVELSQHSGITDIELADPSSLPGRTEAAWLMENFLDDDNLRSEEMKALQVAIWEVVNDHNEGHAYDLTAGNFVLIAGQERTREIAGGYLSELADLASEEFAAFDADGLYQVAISSTKQDFIVNIGGFGGPGGGGGGSETPEPATMFLLGAGLVGLAAFRKRFVKKA